MLPGRADNLVLGNKEAGSYKAASYISLKRKDNIFLNFCRLVLFLRARIITSTAIQGLLFVLVMVPETNGLA